MPLEIRHGDLVRMRKRHPCGSYEWRVIRVGADIGIKCEKCHRRVLLGRRLFERKMKAILSQQGSTEGDMVDRSSIEA